MRKIVNLFVVIALMGLWTSCGGGGGSIEGEWKFDFDSYKSVMSDEEKAQYDALPDDQKTMWEEMFKNMTFKFNNDGTYEMSMGEGEGEKGKWELSEDKKTLKATKEGSDRMEELKVVELSGSKLVIEGPDGKKMAFKK